MELGPRIDRSHNRVRASTIESARAFKTNIPTASDRPRTNSLRSGSVIFHGIVNRDLTSVEQHGDAWLVEDARWKRKRKRMLRWCATHWRLASIFLHRPLSCARFLSTPVLHPSWPLLVPSILLRSYFHPLFQTTLQPSPRGLHFFLICNFYYYSPVLASWFE